jgi:hypothetical protein
LAVFLAVRPGQAAVVASTDTACRHLVPACELAQREWRVTFVVVGG